MQYRVDQTQGQRPRSLLHFSNFSKSLNLFFSFSILNHTTDSKVVNYFRYIAVTGLLSVIIIPKKHYFCYFNVLHSTCEPNYLNVVCTHYHILLFCCVDRTITKCKFSCLTCIIVLSYKLQMESFFEAFDLLYMHCKLCNPKIIII